MLARYLTLGLVFALLAGCAGVGQREAVEGQGDPRQWAEHKARVATLDGWQISGKVGIRAPRDSGSGSLFWLQRQDYYDIRLSGPLGRGAARLTGRPGAVQLESSEGRYAAESPEALLTRQVGWQLPVSNLLWWIRGLPAPDSKSRVSLDAGSHLARLEQDGWSIEYTRYADFDGYTLPERLKLTGQDVEVILVVKEWQPRVLGH
ncbi:lipoprotein insertase outer membrane protein LolB [Pseudomonas matsuisoli]|uniref:Outer-membrane lipoprotein LolB n=1 Tax=Pseudomonas matsuisoli TaxID=1515666 RepID=A0A917PV54_9PSED|nr:lipoprotein insertase outer membrane protein LolB [Pseudomonas matsuisoli]GGJ92991.1 outer-membrane lipoprotein LolB [Pseudomonas matsuisoli]